MATVAVAHVAAQRRQDGSVSVILALFCTETKQTGIHLLWALHFCQILQVHQHIFNLVTVGGFGMVR